MSDLLPTILSDDENNDIDLADSSSVKQGDDDDEFDEVDPEFRFGLGLNDGGDGDYVAVGKKTHNPYRAALEVLEKFDRAKGLPERTGVGHIIAAARKNMLSKKRGKGKNGVEYDDIDYSRKEELEDKDIDALQEGEELNDNASGIDEDDNDDDEVVDARDDSDGDEDIVDAEENSNDNDSDNDSESSSDEDEGVDESDNMEEDVVKERSTTEDAMALSSKVKGKKKTKSAAERKKKGNDDDYEEEEEDDDPEARARAIEAARAAEFFDSTSSGVDAENDDESKLFVQLHLSRPLLRGVAAMGYVSPTPVQAAVIPSALAGRDMCASAVTGSGKTAAFVLPMLERWLSSSSSLGQRSRRRTTFALVLVPTRELAVQCLACIQSLGRFCRGGSDIDNGFRATLVVGGRKDIYAQAAELRSKPDAVVATPGRLLDHLTNDEEVRAVLGEDLTYLVLDEADRLLDLGFQEELTEILKHCSHPRRQTLLFSATLQNAKVDDLVRLSLKRPLKFQISSKPNDKDQAPNSATDVEVAPRLEQEFIRIRSSNEPNREAILLSLLCRPSSPYYGGGGAGTGPKDEECETLSKKQPQQRTTKTIVFFATRKMCHRFRIVAGLSGLPCVELHGDLTQGQRLEALEDFASSTNKILLATDLAARGLDLPDVDAVLNHDFPSTVETYVHRIGRTARAGRRGIACTLLGEPQRYRLKELIRDHNSKGTKAAIRSRTVPAAVVQHFRDKINSLEDTIKQVTDAEEVARLDRIAEMEATRAQNLIVHADEIKARNRRKWTIGRNGGENEPKGGPSTPVERTEEGTGTHRLTRKKRRAREAMEGLKEAQRERVAQADADGVPRPRDPSSAKSMKAEARSFKKEERLREKERLQKSVHDEDVERNQKESKKARKKGKKRDDFGGLDGTDDAVVHYAKAKDKEDERQPSQYVFRGYDPDKKFGKGGKKTHHKFKSKTKYRRRK